MSNVTITETVNQVNILDDENQTVEIIAAGPQGPSPALTIDDDSIVEAKLDIHADPSGTNKFLGYTSNGMEWAVPPDTQYSVGDNGLTKNNFTDALKTKLDSVESNSTADMTGSEIKTAYEAESNTNAFTDALKTKLEGIEASATGDQTNAEIRTAVEAASDSNVFTDADHTKLNGIESSATADQTGAEIKTAYEGESDTNAFTDTEKTKLSGIATSANNYAISSDLLDEDNMATNSATKVPSQQSVKAYVDANSGTTYTAGTGLNLSGTEFSVTSLALTTVQEAANESAQLSLTTQEGDVVVRTDSNQSFVKNAGTAGTMADFTLLRTPTDAVLSVNGNTGAITAAQIASAVEAASDSNTFTDADHTKLNGIETSATADQTGAEIKTAYEAESDTNAYTDAEKTKLAGIEASATADQTNAEIRAAVEAASDSNVFTDADHTKLNGIETSATADQTGAEIKTAYEAESDTNAYTDAEKTKLLGIATGATNTAAPHYTSAIPVGDGGLTTNDFTNADHTKLDGIATGAEVNVQSDWNETSNSSDAYIQNKPTIPTNTDTTYGISCVDGDNSDEEKIRLTAGGSGSGTDDVVLEAGTGLSIARSGDKITFTNTVTDTNTTDLVSDTSPQLGGSLDVNSQDIVSTSNGDIDLDPNGSGKVVFKGNATKGSGQFVLNCENNSHGIVLKGPPHSAAASYTFTFPNDDGNADQVLKTDGSGTTSWVDQTTAYTNSSVDTHLNTSTASTNEVLSWNGSDYDWVAQSGGGGGISNLVEDTTPQLGGNLDMQSNNISGTGTVIAASTAVATAGFRKIHSSTSAPGNSDGSVGDLWVKF